ncbi:MAG: hypothetical protein ISS34_05520 [Candidatus Omnitrophica bacterium]|nr:hypothetical protein [Candidatus Omnitrophota bacterium]
MAEKIDIKKLQKKATKALKEASRRLEGAGKDARVLVKRGEDELIKLSKVGRAQLEILALSLKKEQLYRQIGMKVWQLSTGGKLTTKKLKIFCEELSSINKNVKSKKKSINKVLKTR